MQTCRQSCAADFSTLCTFSRVQAGLPCSKRMLESRRPDMNELVRILVLSLVWYPLKKTVKCVRASPQIVKKRWKQRKKSKETDKREKIIYHQGGGGI